MSAKESMKKLAGKHEIKTGSLSSGRPSGQIPDQNFHIVEPVGFPEVMDNSAAHFANESGKLANGRGAAPAVAFPKA
jgi:hypothetical protein